jgi:hypothetical protein
MFLKRESTLSYGTDCIPFRIFRCTNFTGIMRANLLFGYTIEIYEGFLWVRYISCSYTRELWSTCTGLCRKMIRYCPSSKQTYSILPLLKDVVTFWGDIIELLSYQSYSISEMHGYSLYCKYANSRSQSLSSSASLFTEIGTFPQIHEELLSLRECFARCPQEYRSFAKAAQYG